MKRRRRRKAPPGVPATKAQVRSLYAVMAAPRPAPPPTFCPRCSGTLDPGTGWCEPCKGWQLLQRGAR